MASSAAFALPISTGAGCRPQRPPRRKVCASCGARRRCAPADACERRRGRLCTRLPARRSPFPRRGHPLCHRPSPETPRWRLHSSLRPGTPQFPPGTLFPGEILTYYAEKHIHASVRLVHDPSGMISRSVAARPMVLTFCTNCSKPFTYQFCGGSLFLGRTLQGWQSGSRDVTCASMSRAAPTYDSYYYHATHSTLPCLTLQFIRNFYRVSTNMHYPSPPALLSG